MAATIADLHAHPAYREWVRVLREFPDRALVAADWIEEQGYPERAELIRVMCALAELPPLVKVLADPRNGDQLAGWRVSGCLLGSPTGIDRGAVVDWEADSVGGGGRWSGSGVVESVGLDAHGLRVQIKPLGGPPKASSHDRDALWSREDELLSGDYGRNWRHWAGEAVGVIPDGALYTEHLTFRNGFVAAVRCPADAWLRHGDAVFAAHPVRRVELTTRPETVRYLNVDGALRVVVEIGSWAEAFEAGGLETVAWADIAGRVETHLHRRWPGVTFTLPPEPQMPDVWATSGTVSEAPTLEQIRQSMSELRRIAAVADDAGVTLGLAAPAPPSPRRSRGRRPRRGRP